MVGLTAWSLIFGGCCSNVFTLEAIVKHEPESGLVITLMQLILTTLFALPTQLESTTSPAYLPDKKKTHSTSRSFLPWRLRTPSIPLDRLAIQASMFFAVNMLNNWAFAFNISVPMHIILRSFGSVTTLAVGWLTGKKFSKVQVGAVAALTVGVVVSAWADASAKGANLSLMPSFMNEQSANKQKSSYASGLLILFTAQLISAWMGVYTENTYARYGRHWQEILFYSHLLGLVFSLAFAPTILYQLQRLVIGPPASIPAFVRENTLLSMPTTILQRFGVLRTGAGGSISQSLVLLFLNGLTQVACISGVNLLSAQTTAVTVTVVLNIRKLVSFLLSCVVFGNPVGGLMAVGAALVFMSGAIYGWDETRRKSKVKLETNGETQNGGVGSSNGTLKSANGAVQKAQGKVQ